MPTSELTGKIQTVTGLIHAAALGPTLMHEHLVVDLNLPHTRNELPGEPDIEISNCCAIRYGQIPSRKNFRLNEPEIAIAELEDMYAAGGRGLVELTVGGLQPDPAALVKIAEATNVHIIMGCGHYVEEYQDAENATRTVEYFAQEMIEQVTVGAWGTKVRAGIIGEIGCQSPWTEQEHRVMRGAIIAQKETGASVNVHPGRRADQPQEVAEFFVAEGASTDRLIISHIDRTIFDTDTLLKLADTGCVIEFDLFGWEQSSYPLADIDMPNDGARIKLIKALVDRGHAEQVVISHDICTKVRLGHYGGHGYRHIFAHVMPLMAARGISQADIDTIMVKNPRRLLTFA